MFRRKKWSKRPSPRFGGRTGLRLKDPQRHRRLEQANFFIKEFQQVDNGSESFTIAYTHLASIALSLDFQNASNAEQRVGTVLASMQRSIDVVGLHFDWQIRQGGFQTRDDGEQRDGMVWSCFQLATDRLLATPATDVPQPATLGSYDPFVNGFPTAVLGPSTPDQESRQNTLPTRVHWTKTQCHYLRTADFFPSTDPTGLLSVPNGQLVDTRHPTFNRRLRVRLDDDHGLFLIWAFRTGPTFDIPDAAVRRFDRWARGTLYYRFSQ